MKKIQILSIMVFLASASIFEFSKLKDRFADQEGPEITMDESTVTVLTSAGEEEVLAGVHARDKKDGDVTDTLLVENQTNFIEKGKRQITIAAFDSDNHVTKVTREVVYSDYQSPKFSLSAPLRFPMGVSNIIGGLRAEDVLDGSLTANIKISNEYRLAVDTPGDYPMMFTVSNSAGDTVHLPVTVQIYNPTEEMAGPQIELSQYIVYTKPDEKIKPWDYVQAVTLKGKRFIKNEDGVLRDPEPMEGQSKTEIRKDELNIHHEIDYHTPGVYEITYQMDEEEYRMGSVRLIVVVSE